MKKQLQGMIVLLVALLLSACNSTTGKTFAIETITPTIVLTSTPMPSPTATITMTPTPAPSPTPIGGSGFLLIDTLGMGINQLDLQTQQISQIFPLGYRLEGASPEGDRFLISKDRNLDIFDPSTGDLLLLSDFFVHKEGRSVLWIPEPETVFFLGSRGGMHEIYSINPDGTELLSISNTTSKYVSLSACANGFLFWEQESGKYWDRYTSLNPLVTEIIYWPFLSETEFSQDGMFLAFWEPDWPDLIYSRDQIESWKDPLKLSIYDLKDSAGLKIRYSQFFEGDNVENKILEINLREKYGIGKYDSSSIEGIWWSLDNSQFLLGIKECPRDSWCWQNYSFYIFKRSGELIKKLELPERKIHIYTEGNEENHERKWITPGYFQYSNPWSPDGNQVVFYNRSNLYLYDPNIESYREIKGILPLDTEAKVVWSQAGRLKEFSFADLQSDGQKDEYVPIASSPYLDTWQEIKPVFSETLSDSEESWPAESYGTIMGWSGYINGLGKIKVMIENQEWNVLVALIAIPDQKSNQMVNLPVTVCVGNPTDTDMGSTPISRNPTDNSPGTNIGAKSCDQVAQTLEESIGKKFRGFFILPPDDKDDIDTRIKSILDKEITSTGMKEFVENACVSNCYLRTSVKPSGDFGQLTPSDALNTLLKNKDPWGIFVQGIYLFSN